MTNPESLNKKHIAVYVVGSQAVIATILSAFLWIAVSEGAALAALVGGWIATVANLHFAIQTFRYSGEGASQVLMRSFYIGEAGKFVIVMVLFLVAFRFLPGARENAAYLFSAFFVVYVGGWLAPVVLQR